MKKNNNIRLVLSLAVMLASVTVVFYLQQGQTKVIVDPAIFKIEDVAAVNRVVLTSPAGKIELKYDGRRWALNGKYDADDQLIKVLMATILQVTPKHLVSPQQKDSIQSRLEKTGTTVSIYNGEGLEKEFLAGGNAEKTLAWYRNPKTGEIYQMSIPGYRVYASGIFELKESEWRDKRIFNFNWRNFRQLTFSYPKEPASDFEFVKQKDFLGIVGLENPDSTRINNFLNDVLTLTADQIVAPGASRMYDSLVKTPAVIRIDVNDIAKHTYTLELFGQPRGQTKVAGRTWDGEIVVFERRKLFPVIKKKNYFRGTKALTE